MAWLSACEKRSETATDRGRTGPLGTPAHTALLYSDRARNAAFCVHRSLYASTW